MVIIRLEHKLKSSFYIYILNILHAFQLNYAHKKIFINLFYDYFHLI